MSEENKQQVTVYETHEVKESEANARLIAAAGEIIDVSSTKFVDIDRSEIDMQIATARQYPRSIEAFRKQALSMAMLDEETAASCFYVLPRGGKKIEGPGIRLAEIVALSWGNLRYGARVLGEDDTRKNIIAEGFAHDLQTNNRVAIRVLRRITDKYGKRYNDDMIAVTGNSACSIALRNAIFKIIPMTYVQAIYQKAKSLAIGDATSLSDRRHKMMEHFVKFGVTKERILARLKKPSIDDIDLTDIEMLVGLSTSIKDGEIDVDSAFPTIINGGPEKLQTLADKVKNKVKDQTKTDSKPETMRVPSSEKGTLI